MPVDVVEERDHFCEPLHLPRTVRDEKSIYANVKRPYLSIKSRSSRHSRVEFFQKLEDLRRHLKNRVLDINPL